jgi:predicted PurR-regulated permease PerM
LTLASIVVAIAALHFAKEILLPLALAVLVSFLLTPPANRLERLGLGRIPSVIAVVLIAFLGLGALGWVVTSQLVDLSGQLPRYRNNIIAKIREAMPRSTTLQKASETIEDISKELTGEGADEGAEGAAPKADDTVKRPRETEEGADEGLNALIDSDGWFRWAESSSGEDEPRRPVDVRVVGLPPSPLNQIREWLGPLVAPLTTAGIAVVLILFMLIQREDQRNRLLQLFGGSNLHATTEALTDITERVSKYLRMQFLINAGYGVCVGGGLWLMGLPNSVMWGVLSFALRFLPYIGPWLSAIMPLAVSVAVSEGWSQPVLVLCWFAVLELLVNNVAEPLLYGRSTGVSGVGVIVAAVFWTWVWGTIGLVLAMPLTVCLVVMARYIPALRFLTVLLGDQPALALEERIYQRLLVGDVEEAKKLCLVRLEEAPLAQVYDELLIPTLRLAEQDRHAGLLSDGQEELVNDSARDLVEDLGDEARKRAADAESAPAPPTAARRSIDKVLCIPLRDEADGTSAIMLKQVLALHHLTVDVASVGALTGELVESVESAGADLVVVSVLPPLPPRNSRLLSRRLRERYPELPILVGFWNPGGAKELQERLAAADDVEILSTLTEVEERVRAIASQGVETPAAGKPAG